MDLEGYLAAHRLSLQQVYQALDDAVGVWPGDVVFLSGSLLADLGNVHSDIDAFIVTSRALPPATVGDVFMLPLEDIQIDLERWTPATIDSLFARVEELSRRAGARDPRPAMMFTGRELEFLYRLRIGRPLTEASCFAALVARVKPELVAQVLFDRARVVAAAVQADIAGFLHDGDEGSAFLSARHLLDVTADAFLASQGQINPGPKWRYRLLDALGPRPSGLDLPPQFGGPRMVDTFMRLWSRTARDNGLADYARQAVRLLNLVMPWCQRQLTAYDMAEERPARVTPPGYGPLEPSLGPLADPSPDSPLGLLRTEARVSWNGHELRLHCGEAYTIGIGRVAHMALAYFDGRTTVREAADRLAARYESPPELLLRALMDLRAVLLSCGYLHDADRAPRHGGADARPGH